MAGATAKAKHAVKIDTPSDFLVDFLKKNPGFRMATQADRERKRRDTALNKSKFMKDADTLLRAAAANGGFKPFEEGVTIDFDDASNPYIEELRSIKAELSTVRTNLINRAIQYGLPVTCIKKKDTRIIIGGPELF